MHKRRLQIWLISILLVVVSAFIYSKYTSDLNRAQLLSFIIKQNMENYHFSNKKMNDEFSRKSFQEYIKSQDYSKRFYLASDIKRLDQYMDKFDDELASGSLDLNKVAVQILESRIKRVKGFYRELLKEPFVFTENDFLELDGEKRVYCQNFKELREYWSKILKYHTLMRCLNQMKVDKTDQISPEIEKKARIQVAKNFESLFDRLLAANQNDSDYRYFNSVTSVFDPHSTYLPPTQKENLEMEMSGKLEGIGALLGEEEGYIKVVRIIPGGPSWRQKKLEEGDLILKVAQADEEFIDIIGMRVQDSVKLIRGNKGTTVRLTVKKPDGRIEVIPVIRDVVIIEETFAKSAVLFSTDNDLPIGYIYLPKFYNDFTDNRGRNSTDDLKNEITKLKEKKVTGIILDLRGNSGGLLMEAITASGLFIKKGPIVQIKSNANEIRILEDEDASIHYDGPLILLTDSSSASAAEIMAAAMQDYQRAIILGSEHSFGKGTVQALIDLNQYMPKNSPDFPELGAIKITIQKFYRISGSSNQFTGITPDIILPDRSDYLEIGEKYLDYSLPWDSIEKVNFNSWEKASWNISELKAKSNERVLQCPYFSRIKDYIKRLILIRDNTQQSLNLKMVLKEQKELEIEADEIDKLIKKIPKIKVTATEEKKAASKELEKVAQENQKEWFERINSDMFIKEAMNILQDIS
jgi:carboxyl-terminal processing protease